MTSAVKLEHRSCYRVSKVRPLGSLARGFLAESWVRGFWNSMIEESGNASRKVRE